MMSEIRDFATLEKGFIHLKNPSGINSRTKKANDAYCSMSRMRSILPDGYKRLYSLFILAIFAGCIPQ